MIQRLLRQKTYSFQHPYRLFLHNDVEQRLLGWKTIYSFQHLYQPLLHNDVRQKRQQQMNGGATLLSLRKIYNFRPVLMINGHLMADL